MPVRRVLLKGIKPKGAMSRTAPRISAPLLTAAIDQVSTSTSSDADG